jgi:hypothetical protein
MTASYAPDTAIREYQASLAKPDETPAALLDTYVLQDEPANWNRVLNMGAGKGGLRVYATPHLQTAKSWLLNPVGHKPHGDTIYTVSEQLDRVSDELQKRPA